MECAIVGANNQNRPHRQLLLGAGVVGRRRQAHMGSVNVNGNFVGLRRDVRLLSILHHVLHLVINVVELRRKQFPSPVTLFTASPSGTACCFPVTAAFLIEPRAWSSDPVLASGLS